MKPLHYLPALILLSTLCGASRSAQAQYVSGSIVSSVTDFIPQPSINSSDSHSFYSSTPSTWLVPFEVDANASVGVGKDASGMAKGSMGVLHAKTFAEYVYTGEYSYSNSHAAINVLDYGIAQQQVQGQDAVSFNIQLDMSGSQNTPDFQIGGSYEAFATAGYSITDGISTASLTYSSHANSPMFQTATFNTVAGRQLTIQYNIDCVSYVSGEASQRQATVDYSNTMHVYIDPATPGSGLTTTSGFNYASAVPEPGIVSLVAGMCTCSLLIFRRRWACNQAK